MKKHKLLYPDHPDGIYRYEYPILGGIPQYVQIRGENRNNPVLIFIHGGPGGSLAGVTHILHAGWERHFTVVNWEQRNTCKTYTANRSEAKEIAQTGTMEQYLEDLRDLIVWLRMTLKIEQVILMGFSWGSAIAAEYVKRNPVHVRCLINVGQLVNYRDGILTTCRKLLDRIPQGSPDAKKICRLMDTFPEHPVWDKKLMSCMRDFMPMSQKYLIKHARATPINEILRSPFWTISEKLYSMTMKPSHQTATLRTMLEYDFRKNRLFHVPVLFLFGEEDPVCPPELVEDFFDEIISPDKQIFVIPEAAHCCFYDQPEVFMQKVLAFLQPYQ